MKKFKFIEKDYEGHVTLDVMSKADNFNKWMFETINTYCSGAILEIGSGIGNISKYFIENNTKITLSDVRDNYIDNLKINYKFKNILKLDLVHPFFDSIYHDLFDTFDSIFALNVVEHIENDIQAIENCKKLLKKNGNLIILVPAYQFLYNKFDLELQHYRRYNSSDLKKCFLVNGFKIIDSKYFNFFGIFGWFFSGYLQKNKTIPSNQLYIFDKLVPFFKLIDKIMFNRIGLSIIVVGKK